MEPVIPKEWLTFLTGLDLQVMFAIAVVSFLMTRSKHVSAELALWFPVLLGALYGLTDAMGANEQAAGWRLITIVMKGATLNGAGAALIGRAAAMGLAKLWGEPPPIIEVKPATPPAVEQKPPTP